MYLYMGISIAFLQEKKQYMKVLLIHVYGQFANTLSMHSYLGSYEEYKET